MKELFRERDGARIGYYQSLLEEAGIQTHVRNRDLVTGMGTEVPIPEFFPALCVVNDEDYERAIEFLREAADEESPVDLPHQTKGIVVVGVCGLCCIPLACGLFAMFGNLFVTEAPAQYTIGGLLILAGIFGIRRVISSYRQTQMREDNTGQAA